MTMRRGDTMVEVILAFAIFALIAVSTTFLMNRSLSMGQRSLEITLARQQIDSQAELLRYACDNDLPAWSDITTSASAAGGQASTTSFDACPDAAVLTGTNAFYMNIDPSGGSTEVTRVDVNSSSYTDAGFVSQVSYGATSRAEGIWVMPVRVGTSDAYDMYIRACWDTVGSTVRKPSRRSWLYET